jgi:hypothetical protein
MAQWQSIYIRTLLDPQSHKKERGQRGGREREGKKER